MAGSTKLGEARVDVTADTSDLRSKLSDARAQVDEFGNASEKSARKAKKSFSQVSEEMQAVLSRQAGVITGFLGVGAAVAGIGFAAFKTGRQIRDAFTGDAVTRFRGQLEDAGSSFDSLIDQINRVSVESAQAFQGAAAIAREYRTEVDSLLDTTANAVSQRGIGQTLRDAFKFGLDGVTGAQSELFEATEEQLEKLSQARQKADRLARRNAEIESRNTARALIESAADAAEAQFIGPQTESEKRIQQLQGVIDDLKQSLSGRGITDELASSIREQIANVQNAIADVRDDELEATQQAAEQQRLAIVQQFRDESKAIRDAQLTPLERELQDLSERESELRERLGELADPEAVSALRDLLASIDARQASIEDQMQQQARDIGREVGLAVTEAINNSTNILNIIGNLRTAAQGINNLNTRL